MMSSSTKSGGETQALGKRQKQEDGESSRGACLRRHLALVFDFVMAISDVREALAFRGGVESPQHPWIYWLWSDTSNADDQVAMGPCQ